MQTKGRIQTTCFKFIQLYPTIPEGIREINEDVWAEVEKSFNKKDNDLLIRQLLKFDLFPIKDSYIAYLKRDGSAIDRNPRTINRICGRLYEMGLDKRFERCSEPKETNRQIGPMFRDWLKRKSLGVEPISLDEFLNNDKDAITDGRASTISNSRNGDVAYSDKLLGNDFLDFIKQRLLLLKELMSEQGSIYLHIDYKIGHYVKIVMDDVFGIENFRNDITRIKCNPKNFNRLGYGNVKDLILFYTKSSNPIWNEPREKYTEKDFKNFFLKWTNKGEDIQPFQSTHRVKPKMANQTNLLKVFYHRYFSLVRSRMKFSQSFA